MGKETKYEPSPALEIDNFFFNALALQNELLREVGVQIPFTERRCEGAPKPYPHINIPRVSKNTVELLTRAGFIDNDNKSQAQTEITIAVNRGGKSPTAMRAAHYIKVRNFMEEYHEKATECGKRFNQWAVNIVTSEKLAITNIAMQKQVSVQEQARLIIQGLEQLDAFLKMLICRESDGDEKHDLGNRLLSIIMSHRHLAKIAEESLLEQKHIELFKGTVEVLQRVD